MSISYFIAFTSYYFPEQDGPWRWKDTITGTDCPIRYDRRI